MLRIGLTGGIGSGKSTVSKLFEELGVPVIDTDKIARDVVEPGTQGLQKIHRIFGEEIFDAHGKLNRHKLRELVFSDESKRKQLEEILHPLIRQEMQRQIANLNAPYVILAIPLLIEKQWQQQLHRVLVVDCSEEQQRSRATRRDNHSAQTVKQIMASQVSRTERIAAADDLIDNSGSVDALREQVNKLHHYYMSLTNN